MPLVELYPFHSINPAHVPPVYLDVLYTFQTNTLSAAWPTWGYDYSDAFGPHVWLRPWMGAPQGAGGFAAGYNTGSVDYEFLMDSNTHQHWRFVLPESIASGKIECRVDDGAFIYVNGHLVGSGSLTTFTVTPTPTQWQDRQGNDGTLIAVRHTQDLGPNVIDLRLYDILLDTGVMARPQVRIRHADQSPVRIRKVPYPSQSPRIRTTLCVA